MILKNDVTILSTQEQEFVGHFIEEVKTVLILDRQIHRIGVSRAF